MENIEKNYFYFFSYLLKLFKNDWKGGEPHASY